MKLCWLTNLIKRITNHYERLTDDDVNVLTHYPTPSLRWAVRRRVNEHYPGIKFPETMHLQQLHFPFDTSEHEPEWRDVPVKDLDPLKSP